MRGKQLSKEDALVEIQSDFHTIETVLKFSAGALKDGGAAF